MKLSATLITALGLALGTAEAKQRHCYQNGWGIIASAAPNLIQRTEQLCHNHHGESVYPLNSISNRMEFPKSDGSGPFAITAQFTNHANGPDVIRIVNAKQCTELFAALITECGNEVNPHDRRLFHGGALQDFNEDNPDGWSAYIDLYS